MYYKILEIEVTKSPTDKISHLDMDLTGQHVIISTTSGDVYYLHVTMKKPRLLPRMKVRTERTALSKYASSAKQRHLFQGHIVTAVGWNGENTRENSTGFIIIGTNKGQLYETEISVPLDDKSSGNRPANVLSWNLVREHSSNISKLQRRISGEISVNDIPH